MSFDYRKEFPDYPQAEMPAIPADFVDTSWHNNACPSFTSDLLGLHLWMDYPKPEDREHQGPRFILERQDRGIEIGESVIETNNWDQVVEAIRLQSMEAVALNDWYEEKVGYRPQVDDPSMDIAALRTLCQERLAAEADA